MEQQERFAVGMIGLALSLDREFRAHFLHNICELKDWAAADGWEVLVEPGNWGDLVLEHRVSSSLVVAEFKIDSRLNEHQNPSKRQFTLPPRAGRCAGYGWEIVKNAQREKWTNLRYLTVEKRASWSRIREEHCDLRCIHGEWRQFLRKDVSEESRLETEVYDCLAQFGVPVFTWRRMRHMKLAAHATEPLALLIGVLARFGADFRPKLLDVGQTGADLGVNIPVKDFPNIARVVEPDGDIAGWFGYQSNPPGPRLSVEFYCYSPAGIKAGPRDRIQAALRKAGFQEDEFGDNGYCVVVSRKAEDSAGDAEWFTGVLNALNQ
jgi:hypothetical protein